MERRRTLLLLLRLFCLHIKPFFLPTDIISAPSVVLTLHRLRQKKETSSQKISSLYRITDFLSIDRISMENRGSFYYDFWCGRRFTFILFVSHSFFILVYPVYIFVLVCLLSLFSLSMTNLVGDVLGTSKSLKHLYHDHINQVYILNLWVTGRLCILLFLYHLAFPEYP